MKGTIKNVFIGIYQSLVAVVMMGWVGTVIIIFTQQFEETIQSQPIFLQILYILGSVNLIMLSLTKNWSVFSFKSNSHQTRQKRVSKSPPNGDEIN